MLTLFKKFTLETYASRVRFSLYSACFSMLCIAQVAAQKGTAPVSLEDIWLKGTFRTAYYPEPRWVGNAAEVMELQTDQATQSQSLMRTDVATGQKKVWLPKVNEYKGQKIAFEDFIINEDESKVLFSLESEPIYRRSEVAFYYCLDKKTQVLKLVSDTALGKIGNVTFAPDGKRIAFTRANNLFISDLITGKETQVTFDGKKNEFINGSTDWVYEEEFEVTRMYTWSPDSRHLVFLRFDERSVKEYNMQLWNQSYPIDYRYKYPKAGEANSILAMFLFTLDDNKTREVDLGPNTDLYIPRLGWTREANIFWFYELNRAQNHLKLYHVDLQTLSKTKVYEEKNAAYLEINDHLHYLPNKKGFILSSEKSGYRHFYYYQMDGSAEQMITWGAWEIDEIAGIDETNGWLYYTSTESSPLDRPLYKVKLDGTGKTKCSSEAGVHHATLSPDGKFYYDTFSSLSKPPQYTFKSSANDSIYTYPAHNGPLLRKLDTYAFAPVETFTMVTTLQDTLNAFMIKPRTLVKKKMYPVLLDVYGGPGHQTVKNEWIGPNYFWFQHLVDKGYIVVAVDGRGTGGRGERFKKCTQHQLGVLETEDLIEAAKYLARQPYIDSRRIGIFGWSFGGYLSSMAITKGADYFKTAVAVAPVIHWGLYDNIYTERFMGLPGQNPEGYKKSSPLTYANKFKGNYLLIHGTADDNVHVQNSMYMQEILTSYGKFFDFYLYSNKNHGIYGGITRYHLYKMITDFLLEKL